MSSYTVIAGDNFDLISRKVYGEESQASRIRKANPGINEPLTPGVIIATPSLLGLPEVTPLSIANPEELQLLIGGKRFDRFESITISRSIDTVDVIGFTAPFEPNSLEFRNTFRPFSFSDLEVFLGGKLFFKGTLIDVNPVTSVNRKAVEVSGYSRPGVIFDCMVPSSSFPELVEFDNSTLKQIADALCDPLGIAVEETSGAGPQFERAAIMPGKRIGSFLITLAKQRGQILSSTKEGNLLIHTSVQTGDPVASLKEGASPVVSVTPTFKSQNYFSSITGISLVWLTAVDEAHVARNNFLPGIIRPFTFEVKDIQVGAAKKAAEAKLGRMFGEVVKYVLEVPTWRDPLGNLWEPNTTLILESPGAMIYNPFEFLIKSVNYTRVADKETAQIELVIPGSYSGELPETLPWLE